jgi:hypothetical protein
MESAPKPVVVSVNDKLPSAGIRVIVVGTDARCLGYRDRHGIWHDDAQHRELRDAIGWLGVWNAGNTVKTQTR